MHAELVLGRGMRCGRRRVERLMRAAFGGAVLWDQHDNWATAERRHLSEESMAAIDHEPVKITTTNIALPTADLRRRSEES